MTLSEKKPAPFFSHPVRQILSMLLVLGLVGAGAWLAYPTVAPVVLANVWLNGVIFAVFVVGVLACFAQVFALSSSVGWIEGFASGRPGADIAQPPRLLAPLANMLRSRDARMQLSSSSSRSILESVATRIEEARDITRYIVNLLIFLGLLGTFYGLATTVPAVVETIRSLAPQEGEQGVAVFDRLMTGLEAQLGGMGTAFSSSLLGLAGSLVVGLLELFAGHGQNRFYRELEEWLSSITRVGIAGAGDGEGADMGAMASVLDQMSEQMEVMKSMITQADMSWAMVDERLGGLAEAVERLSSSLENDRSSVEALDRIADAQAKIAEGQDKIVEQHGSSTEWQTRMADGQDKLAEALGKASAWQDRMADGQDKLIAAQGRLTEDREKTVAWQDKMVEGHERMAAGQDKIAEGQQRIAEGQDKVVESQDLLAEAQAKIADGQQRLANIQDRIAAAEDRVADGQDRLITALESRISKEISEGEDTGDAESRMRLRSIDTQLLRILEEMSVGRQESLIDLRTDLAHLTRAVRELSAGGEPGPARGD